MAKNRDHSKSRIVKMPKLHRDTRPADVWFEAGMVYFQDPEDLTEDGVQSVTVKHFAAYVQYLWECINDEYRLRNFVCGTRKAKKFFHDCADLLQEVKGQLHVGMPVELIAKIERERACVSVRNGFEGSRFEAPDSSAVKGEDSSSFKQSKFGLYVPASMS